MAHRTRSTLVWLAILLGVGLTTAGCGSETPSAVASRPGSGTVAPPPTGSIDPGSGLVVAPGWEQVAAHCNGCHSTRHFLRMRGTRSTWDSAISWMQRTQGLWELPDEVRGTIVSYLAEHYGPSESSRRAPIPPDLMPANPYSTPARREAATQGQPR